MSDQARDDIVDAVIHIIGAEGTGGATFEAVAVRTGLTRGGVVYHFPTRDALLRAAHDRLVQQWEAHLADLVARRPSPAAASSRALAYLDAHAEPPAAPLLPLLSEVQKVAELRRLWQGAQDAWVQPPDDASPSSVDLFVVRLAAHGLWLHQALSGNALSPAQVGAVVARLERLVEGDGDVADRS